MDPDLTDDLVLGGDSVSLPLRLLAGGGARIAPEARVLMLAQARLVTAQAVELEATLRASQAAEPVSFLDVAETRMDVAIVGPRGSGKTRLAQVFHDGLASAGVATRWCSCSTTWPSELESASRCWLFLDDAGSVLAAAPERFRDLIARARHRKVSTFVMVQETGQLPPWWLRQGCSLLVTSSPFLWRLFQREELRETLDVAARAIGRRPGVGCYVDSWGVPVPVWTAPR